MTANYLFCAYIRDIITIINRVNNISMNDYVDLDNKLWMIYSYTHPHNGDDIFDAGTSASDRDILIERVKRRLTSCMINLPANAKFDCSIDGVISMIKQHRNKNFTDEICEYLLSLKTISCYDWN